ncbi:hypothetical protein V1281_000024 [Nitrobacteraceae bacterium AZCC 2161]
MKRHLRETGRELRCIDPLRNDFGSIAAIAPFLRQSPEAGIYSAAAQRFSHVFGGKAELASRLGITQC